MATVKVGFRPAPPRHETYSALRARILSKEESPENRWVVIKVLVLVSVAMLFLGDALVILPPGWLRAWVGVLVFLLWLPAGWWSAAIWWSGYRQWGLRQFGRAGLAQLGWMLLLGPLTLPGSLIVAAFKGEPIFNYFWRYFQKPVRQDS